MYELSTQTIHLRHRKKWCWYVCFFFRLFGDITLYEEEEPHNPSTGPQSVENPPMKIKKRGNIHVSVWVDSSGQEANKKWVVAIRGEDVQLVAVMNHFFNRDVTGPLWIKFREFGMYLKIMSIVCPFKLNFSLV